jgi:hypothetical protein
VIHITIVCVETADIPLPSDSSRSDLCQEVSMRKLAMLLLVAITLTVGSVGMSVAHAESFGSYFYDDEFDFLNPQPLPP